MSLGVSAEAVTNSVQTIMIVNNCDIAIMMLLLYDWAITFSEEYYHIWKARRTIVTMIFLANRYLMLLQYTLAPFTDCIQWHDDTSCGKLERTRAGFSALGGIVISGFSSLRVYALSRRHWQYAVAVATLQMANWGINCYLLQSAGYATLPAPLFGCTPVNRLSPHIYNKLVVPGRAFMIASDAIVLIVTWMNTYGVRKVASNAKLRTPLLNLVLRDGTLYFLLTIMMNLTILGLWFNSKLKFFPNLVQPLQSVLISHFLLNLRDISYEGPLDQTASGQTPSAEQTQTRTHASTLRFTAIDIVGNLGAPLRHGYSSSDSDLYTSESTDKDEWVPTEDEGPTVEGPLELTTIRRDEVGDNDTPWAQHIEEDIRTIGSSC